MKNCIKAGIFFLSSIVLSTQFLGCDESSTIVPSSQTIKTVSGNIASFWGEPKAGVKVSTGSADVYTDAEGNFTFANVSAPYNLYFSDTSSGRYYALTELSTEEVRFVLNAEPFGLFNNTCNLRVTASPNGLIGVNKAKYVFTDGEYLNSYGGVNTGSTESVRLREYNSVTGKLFLLGYKTDQNEKIISYERFGQKDVTLSSGGDVTVNFDSSEIAFNPEETTISGTFANYSGSTLFQISSFSFGEYYTPNYATIISFEPFSSSNNFSYVVPSNIPGFFKATIYFESISPTVQKIWAAIDPGTTGGTYELATSPGLLEPQPGVSVNLSTQFKFTEGSRTGIYIVKITDGQKEYWIYTANPEVTLQSLEPFGFSLNSGSSYSWFVTKAGEYNSVNDYAINPAPLSSFSSDSERRDFVGQ